MTKQEQSFQNWDNMLVTLLYFWTLIIFWTNWVQLHMSKIYFCGIKT